ncbi:uncharacterized protein LOC129593478 [Paramacrobiotus metropolitanus]|uniref:uncharacterized protein LOC129593478 n=1 Tax=Paramacrobiotus metropolitanus TaxID=2943436 RepID=UPI002445E14E|nr:uncharacterized protein LOC129593478 [Paramacrobiotus metropolitanus]
MGGARGQLHQCNELNAVANRLRYHHIAASTRQAYDAGWFQFEQFCVRLAEHPLPASDDTVLRFLADLHSRGIAIATAKVYLASIANKHTECEFPIPTRSAAVSRALQGYQRLAPTPRDHRLPITLDIMRYLKDRLSAMNLATVDKHMYWAAFTMAFAGLLRVSEYTAPSPASYSTARTLLFNDIALTADVITVSLKTTKTDQYSHGYKLLLRKTGRSVCPVRALATYAASRLELGSKREPLFILSSRAYLTRQDVDRTLKHLLCPLPEHHRYGTHSFRIGGTTTAAVGGSSDKEIQRLGRWKSNCFSAYVRSQIPTDGINPYA